MARFSAVTAFELRLGTDFTRRAERIDRLLAARTLPLGPEKPLAKTSEQFADVLGLAPFEASQRAHGDPITTLELRIEAVLEAQRYLAIDRELVLSEERENALAAHAVTAQT